MCGIWGQLTKVGTDNLNLKRYAQSIKHRGPDETNVYDLNVDNININLTFHRLAIVDIQNGHQPFVYQFEKRKIFRRLYTNI